MHAKLLSKKASSSKLFSPKFCVLFDRDTTFVHCWPSNDLFKVCRRCNEYVCMLLSVYHFRRSQRMRRELLAPFFAARWPMPEQGVRPLHPLQRSQRMRRERLAPFFAARWPMPEQGVRPLHPLQRTCLPLSSISPLADASPACDVCVLCSAPACHHPFHPHNVHSHRAFASECQLQQVATSADLLRSRRSPRQERCEFPNVESMLC